MRSPLLTAREVAAQFAVAPATVLRWTRRGELPAFKLPSGAIRYDEAALADWLSEHAVAAPGREAPATRTGAAPVVSLTPATSPRPTVAASEDEEDPYAS